MNVVMLNNASLDGDVVVKKGGGSGGAGVGNILTSWEGYDESTMGGYALSAKLGYEMHEDVDGVDSLLDEVNGVTVEMINEINGEII